MYNHFCNYTSVFRVREHGKFEIAKNIQIFTFIHVNAIATVQEFHHLSAGLQYINIIAGEIHYNA